MKALGFLAAACAALLTACGGGGGSSDSSTATATSNSTTQTAVGSAGVWSDGLSGALVTSSGELWAVQQSGSSYYVAQGTISDIGGSVSGSVTSYPYYLAASASVKGTYQAQKTLNASLTNSYGTVYMAGTYLSVYDATPSLSGISGSWVNSNTVALIDSSGTVGGTQSGCAFNGTIKPDSSGKNFYRLTLRFSGSPCLRPNATMNGVVVPLSSTTAMAAVADTSTGFAFFLTKT